MRPCQRKRCDNPADPDSHYCSRHNMKSDISYELKHYLLDKADQKVRLTQLASSDQIQSLVEEISLARMVLERLVNSLEDDGDLKSQVPKIATLLATIERLQKSNTSLQKNLSMVITKPALIRVAGEIGEILVDELQHVEGYEQLLDTIMERVLDTMSNVSNKEEEVEE